MNTQDEPSLREVIFREQKKLDLNTISCNKRVWQSLDNYFEGLPDPCFPFGVFDNLKTRGSISHYRPVFLTDRSRCQDLYFQYSQLNLG